VATTDAVDEGPEVVEVNVVGTVGVAPGGGDTGGGGDMPTEVVTRTIRQRVRAIRRCYERELGRNPNLEGKVTVAFSVMESGTVAHSRVVENTSHNAALGRCVASTLGRMRFHPGPEGGSVDFRYPFVFAPQR
jgi:TonB family protein